MRRPQIGWRAFALGSALGAALLCGLAEAFLRWFPPRDLHQFLGDASPLTGPFVADCDFGVNYSSMHSFAEDNAMGLIQSGAMTVDRRPTWAFFGNSFVQGPGMLADTARAARPDRRVFNLGRNEWLPVRFAQIKLLLENGFAPERIFAVLMPVDLLILGEHPLSTVRVNQQGALTYQPRSPDGIAKPLIEHSRLGLTAWVRSGRHLGNPNFNRKELYDRIDDTLLSDLHRLFGGLSRVAAGHRVPVTVILIPTCHQVLNSASYAFQDTMAALLHQHDFDGLDPRRAFHAHANPPSLYLPDKHLSAEGNRLLFAELEAHVNEQDKSPKYRDQRTAQSGQPPAKPETP